VLAQIDKPAPAGRRAPSSAKEVKKVLKLAAYVQTLLARFDREEGQTMAEYAVILSVITVAVLLALGLLGTNIGNVINRIAGSIS
jgi:Flp pilus assembly pilin Flp